MPLIKVLTSVKCDQDKKESVILALSRIVSKDTSKPEAYVQALIEDDAVISMGGEIRESALVEVRGIGGLTPAVNKTLSKHICSLLESELGISESATYINFMDIAASNWGHKGNTFG